MIVAIIKLFTFVLMLGSLPACFELKEAGRLIGHTVKNGTTDIGHGSRDTVKALGNWTKSAFKSITKYNSQARDQGLQSI